VFHGNRWADVFVGALGENAEYGSRCLKALTPPLKAVPRFPSGYSAAKRLEGTLRESIAEANRAGRESASAVEEFVIRFITLLVEKGRFKHVDAVIEKIDARIDAQKGVLAVTLEFAAPSERAFADDVSAEEFKRRIAKGTGAAEVKMCTRLAPELLGGYKLWIGDFYIDASLKAQAEKMRADLAAAVFACVGERTFASTMKECK